MVNEEEEKQQGQKPGGREATTEGRVKVRWTVPTLLCHRTATNYGDIFVCVTRKKSAAAAITMVCYYEAHWQSTKGSIILMATIYNKKKAERKWK